MRALLGLIVLCAFAATIAACSSSTAASTPIPPYSQTDVVVGTGAQAVKGSLITVNYTGWLYDATKPDGKGVQFETSVGLTPLTYSLGAGQVISGWEQGIPGMLVGGVRRLVLPPALAYGPSRAGPIPPNAALVFDIELLGIQ